MVKVKRKKRECSALALETKNVGGGVVLGSRRINQQTISRFEDLRN